MRAVVLMAALGLAACQPQAPDGAAAPPPADAPDAVAARSTTTDFSQPMIARGNEPFWAVRMEGTRFTLLRPDHPEVVFEAPGATITPGKGRWPAKAADGRTLAVTLYVSDCSDGMSDLRYPMTAEVEFGGETLRGCAAKLSELPREGGG